MSRLGSPDPTATPLRILLVEDDPADALLVEEMLIDTGLSHTLRWRKTLAEALADLDETSLDCVLLDLHLPDVAGFAGVVELRQAAPEAAVIVLTGLAETGVGTAAVAAGAQDYLVKGSVTPDLFQRAMRYAIQRKQAERANAELLQNRIRAEENARLERGLLPRPLLTGSTVQAVTRYLPGREHALLSGDFLDIVQTPDGIVHAVIGDVSGHGPDQAALGVSLRITWRALTLAGHVGVGLLDLLEQILVAERASEDHYATCALVTIDQAAAEITIHLAGHHEPLFIDEDGRVAPLEAQHGMALGFLPGLRRWYRTTVPMPAAGTLLLYTDGLIEGHRGDESGRLGTSGLIDLIPRTADPDPGTHLDNLLDAVRQLNDSRHTDDLAILQVRWDTVGGAASPVPGEAEGGERAAVGR